MVFPGLDEVAHCGDVDYNAWGTSVVANRTVEPAVLDSNPTYLPSMLKKAGKLCTTVISKSTNVCIVSFSVQYF